VNEVAFLALGLVLGIALGAIAVAATRSRPSNAREVRVTVAPGSVPKRRASTLAGDAFAPTSEPARGGPADQGQSQQPAITAFRGGTAVLSGSQPSSSDSPVTTPVGIPIHREVDPVLESLRAAAARSAEAAMTAQRMTLESILDRDRSPVAAGARAIQIQDGAQKTGEAAVGLAMAAADGAAAPIEGTGSIDPMDDDCAEIRRVADERCTIATRSREQATAAQEALRVAQRTYDDHHTAAEQAAQAADPRRIRDAKEAAQNAFRNARATATTREAIEAAARDWLTEINRINHDARDATTRIQRENAAANALVSQIERLTVEADAARISAESAESACLNARQAVADCQEATTAQRRQTRSPTPAALTFGSGAFGDEGTAEPAFSLTADVEPAILRLLRGEPDVVAAVVDELAGSDDVKRQRWQMTLGAFVEAVIARAIEESALTFPVDHPFWGSFTLPQNRDILSALSSLGYRFDGLGGWVDDRIPGQRDLSLAVGYAGLDPMRIRHWPNESETYELLRHVSVAADEYLAETAGGLTLGELVDALGRRADELTDLWNEWGRVRPLLVSP
jgi:hypothetical protein